MAEGGSSRSGLVPDQWRKRPAAPKADAAPQRTPQTAEGISARWNELQNKRGRAELSEEEEREIAGLEAQMRRMRASGMEGGMNQAA